MGKGAFQRPCATRNFGLQVGPEPQGIQHLRQGHGLAVKRQTAFLTSFLQRVAQQGDNLTGTMVHGGTHIFRQVANLCRQLDGKTAANNPLLAELIQRVLIISQQAVTIVAVAMIEVVDQALQISGVVMFEQRDAEGF